MAAVPGNPSGVGSPNVFILLGPRPLDRRSLRGDCKRSCTRPRRSSTWGPIRPRRWAIREIARCKRMARHRWDIEENIRPVRLLRLAAYRPLAPVSGHPLPSQFSVPAPAVELLIAQHVDSEERSEEGWTKCVGWIKVALKGGTTMHTKFTLTIEDADGVSKTIVRETDWPDASPHFLDATEQVLLPVFHALQLESY